jgi:hypothetical protein
MRRLLLFLVFLAVALVDQCQTNDIGFYYTEGEPNGFNWRRMSESEKLGVVEGMAISKQIVYWSDLIPVSAASCVTENDKQSVPWPMTTNGDIMKELATFYSDTANLIFPIHSGVVYLFKRLRGESSASLESWLTYFRRGYSQSGRKK